jgi:SAM-dependent methyltransferase
MKARIYDAINGKLDRAGLAAHRQRLVRDLEGHVLEIGAGTGLNIAHYQRADSITVLEPDVRYARRLRARAGRSQIPIKVVIAAAESIPMPDNSFDHAVASIALCSVTDPAAALAEAWRVLRPGGTFQFLEHTRGVGRLATWQDRLTPLQRRMADGCHLNRNPAAVISDTGFRIRHLEHFTMPAGHPLIKARNPGLRRQGPATSQPVTAAITGAHSGTLANPAPLPTPGQRRPRAVPVRL